MSAAPSTADGWVPAPSSSGAGGQDGLAHPGERVGRLRRRAADSADQLDLTSVQLGRDLAGDLADAINQPRRRH